jgi:hypothetical protein
MKYILNVFFHALISFEDLNKAGIEQGTKQQWYLGIRLLWNKSNLVYVLFGCENFAWYTTFVWNTTRMLELV